MSDNEETCQTSSPVDKVPLDNKTVTATKKERKKYEISPEESERRRKRLVEMRERAALVAKAKREVNPKPVKAKGEFANQPEAVQMKIQEIKKRGDGLKPVGSDAPKTLEGVSRSTSSVVGGRNHPKKKKIVYVSESDSSGSEEEVIIKKPKVKKSYQWTPEDIEDLKQRELETRMKKMEERDEFVRMEKAMLQKRYADKLKEVQRSQLAQFMFGGR